MVTGQLEQSIAGLSDEEVEEFIAYIKSVIAQNDLKDEASINQAIDDACSKYNVTLSDSERQQIVDLLLKITSLGINLDSLVDYAESLYHSFKAVSYTHLSVSCAIPDRMRDGYGINEHLIDAAYEEGMDTIITCDNGIAAINEIAHAKELGMTVLVTDHHEIPYVEEQGVRRYLRSAADAIVNPKQQECSYPYKGDVYKRQPEERTLSFLSRKALREI